MGWIHSDALRLLYVVVSLVDSLIGKRTMDVGRLLRKFCMKECVEATKFGISLHWRHLHQQSTVKL